MHGGFDGCPVGFSSIFWLHVSTRRRRWRAPFDLNTPTHECHPRRSNPYDYNPDLMKATAYSKLILLGPTHFVQGPDRLWPVAPSCMKTKLPSNEHTNWIPDYHRILSIHLKQKSSFSVHHRSWLSFLAQRSIVTWICAEIVSLWSTNRAQWGVMQINPMRVF